MSASDHLSPKQFRPWSNQLPMFATPEEIGRVQSNEHTARSVSQIHLATPDVDSVKRAVDASHGIERPVIVGHVGTMPYLVDGHHRSTVAIKTNRLVPVEHYNGLMAAENAGRKQRAAQYREGWR